MDSPFINTKLSGRIAVRPDQIDNKIYINLKRNLQNKLEKRCYKDYGFIMNIFEVLQYKDGVIKPEDVMSSVTFEILFSCRLCRPLIGTKIICKVDRINKLLMTAINGPIVIVVTNDRVNPNNFFMDNNNVLRFKEDGKSQIVKSNDFIVVKIEKITFNHGDEKIKGIGFIDRMAAKKEVEKFYEELYDENKELVDYKDYVEE